MRTLEITRRDIDLAVTRAHRERSRVAHALLGRVGRWIGETLRPIAGRFRRWNAERRAVAELRGLSNRTLADMGLHRSQIRAAVRALQDEAALTQAERLVGATTPQAENLVPFPSARRARRSTVRGNDVEPIRAAG